METKYNFKKMSIAEFESYVSTLRVGRTILTLQQHHTYSPSYIHYTGNNHFELQKGMKNYHVNSNGWNDIGQHFTTFPDGSVLTGRSMESSPACIYGNNANSICVEHLGNFDKSGDDMTPAQKETIVRLSAALCTKYSIPLSSSGIVYHHWFNLSTGVRNNGTQNNKSCPGSNFFGGNKVTNFESHFLPLIQALCNPAPLNPAASPVILQYAMVTADRLNIRTGAGTSHPIAGDRPALQVGAVVRVYDKSGEWLKISSSMSHWVSARYTLEVFRRTVNTAVLNIRTGPDTTFPKVGALTKDTEVFVTLQQGSWSRIGLDNKWVSTQYLT
jgi:uncharacterized protein YraI